MFKSLLLVTSLLLVGCHSTGKVNKITPFEPLQFTEFTDKSGQKHSYSGDIQLQMFGIWIYAGTKGKKHVWIELDKNLLPIGVKTTCQVFDPVSQTTIMVEC